MKEKFKTNDIKTAGVPAFDEAPGRIRIRFFYVSGTGKFSRRAFFFSLFAFIAVVYVIISMAYPARFSEGVAAFILGCNTAFGINYYKNEKQKNVVQ
jgi:hypothetical protein